jgi:hypothetical protein
VRGVRFCLPISTNTCFRYRHDIPDVAQSSAITKAWTGRAEGYYCRRTHHATRPPITISFHFNSSIKHPYAIGGAEEEAVNEAVVPTGKHSVPTSAPPSRSANAMGSGFGRIVSHRAFLDVIEE